MEALDARRVGRDDEVCVTSRNRQRRP